MGGAVPTKKQPSTLDRRNERDVVEAWKVIRKILCCGSERFK